MAIQLSGYTASPASRVQQAGLRGDSSVAVNYRANLIELRQVRAELATASANYAEVSAIYASGGTLTAIEIKRYRLGSCDARNTDGTTVVRDS